MNSKLHADMREFSGELSRTEERLGRQIMKVQPDSPKPVMRPPWNYGRQCSRPLPVSRNPSPWRGTGTDPTCLRSRDASRSRVRSPKNVVHQQTIDAGNKETIVQVSIKTNHQSRKSSLPQVQTDEYLVNKLSNLGISAHEPKMYDSSCGNPGFTSEAKKEPSWSNILRQKPHTSHPVKAPSKRSPESSIIHHQKPKSDPKTKSVDGQKSSEVWNKEVQLNSGNMSTCVSQNQKLRLLLKERKERYQNDPNVQMLISDIEKVLPSLPASETSKPLVASLVANTESAQPTVSRQPNGWQSGATNIVLPSHDADCDQLEPVTEPSILRLSPDPLSSKQHLLKKTSSGFTGKAGPLIDEFLNMLNSVHEASTQPEDKSKRASSKNEQVPMFKERLANACRALEATCSRVESDCVNLKREKADVERALRDKDTELQNSVRTRQIMEKEVAEMRAQRQRANIELQKLRGELAAKSRTNEHETIIKDFQKRLDELSEANKKLTIEMNMSRMEKEKLSVMLTNKMKEVDMYKKEFATAKRVQIIGLEEDEVQGGREELKKQGRPKKKNYKQKNQDQGTGVNSSVKEESRNPSPPYLRQDVRKKELQESKKQKDEQRKKEGNEKEENVKKEEEEENENYKRKQDDRKRKKLNESCDDVYVVSEVQVPLYFLPVDRKWQKKACEDLELKVARPLKPSHQPVPLGSPKDCFLVAPDGNCFFRCISVYLTGNEASHEFVREAVVQFMVENPSEFEECSDPHYIERMRTLTTWATEVEIRATAKWLDVPIFTYMKYNRLGWKWQRFGPGLDMTGCDSSTGGIYLKNTGSCHYDVVKDVYSCDDCETSS